jgi:hypothetical protein
MPIHDLFYEFSEQACSGTRFRHFENVKAIHHYKNNQSMNEIDQVFDSKNIVAIEYFPSFLYHLEAKPSGLHTSTLVARRYNTDSQACEYLIRNSKGKGCEKYDSRLECVDGQIWVPGTLLESRLISVSHLQ